MVGIPTAAPRHVPDMARLSDADLVVHARMGDEKAIRVLVQRHNRRLFRSARAIVRDDAEAEDIVQATYVHAFTHLDAFRDEAQLSTWLTRIALNEALGRIRRRQRNVGLVEVDMTAESGRGALLQFPTPFSVDDPEAEFSRAEARRLLERAVDRLPDEFRVIFVLRDVEGMSTEEAASYLGIKPATAKTRLHRARKMMRIAIEKQLVGAFSSLFPFDGARCVAMADRVVERLRIAR
ncbi:RNA polymerase sigma factor [Rhizobium lusitanum]|uniref:RNA polymerase sigma factor n=1 Tax=Rhizobium lusitanum TaxID=293958 RepID=A0A1C3XK42_9HYPH|nr:RNA polymerase sigma factor [Rhizobium lusitanum]NTJ10801.1 RNA polymerase sigma factor [Rhizobium lusitanum]SCB52579.1 RNA polymerase sigma-70 factor, ECF subfamily [Rhizobium lusitanum]